MMDWFSAPNYSIARFVIERGLGIIYLVAFLVAFNQFVPLLGERGLLPVPQYLRGLGFWEAPSLFYFGYSDRLLKAVSVTGIVLSLAIVLGLPQAGPLWLPMLVWFVLWALYLSIVNVGQTFYGFGWESLLLEAGFLAIFLGNARTAPPFLVLLLFRWLAFRLELGAGLIKLRGDPCWRDLTCMNYHHETQPMPNPLSWYFHRLPPGLHRFEVLGNHVAQLVGPWLLFLPQPIAAVGGIMMIGTQAYLVVSGNYAWLNWLTILTAVSVLPDGLFRALIPGAGAAAGLAPPAWFVAAVLVLTVVVVVLSYWPVRNLFGRRQLMNYSFNRLHLVGTYGAFGSVTRQRYEVVVEGTDATEPSDAAEWREYEFRGKPGDPRRRPPQVAPYHLRLDWQMWFAALSPGYAAGWFQPFVGKLLEGDRATLGLLRHNPFPDKPPTWIRARYYLYRFTTWPERRETGAWWVRELMGEYLRPVRLARATADGRASG
ncbi:MAG TPA: lipase maturation factor family protein [Gemmatimonadales bacterium]|nr:lipase maturation factor family protein [Gemmatimonadales bacterium]